jgi:peptide/nickel transport system substrate-binding protein
MRGMKMKKLAFGFLLTTFMLASFAGITVAKKPYVDCGKVVFSDYTDIVTMDPAEAFVKYSCMVARNAHEGLVQYNLKDFSIEPVLAKSWELDEDGGTFHLRKGVKFHDGTEFKAEAVRFNWQRIMAINKGPSTWLKDIKDVKVIDDYTVRIETKKNWAFMLDVLASHRCFLMASPTAAKKHATKKDPWATKWFHDHTCGTGPYMAKEWVPNQYISMVRFKDYWKGWPGKHFSEVVIKIVPEASTRRMLIKRGEIDLINNMPAEYWDELDADPNITTLVWSSFSQFFYMLNNHSGPVADKNLRWAITYAVDYEACRTEIKTQPGGLLIGPVYNKDLKKAMEYKNKSAYAGKDVDVTLTYVSGSGTHKKLAVILQDSLSKIGVKAKLRALVWPAFAKELYGEGTKAGDIYTFYASSIIADPYGVLYKVLHSKSIQAGGANLGYSNPKFDALLNQALVTIDREKRMALYEEAKKLAVDDAAYVWLLMLPYFSIHRDNIKVYPYTRHGDAIGMLYYFYDMYRE